MTTLNLIDADPEGNVSKYNIKYFLHSSGMVFKFCKKCRNGKTFDEFYSRSNSKCRLRDVCKKCYNERRRRYKK